MMMLRCSSATPTILFVVVLATLIAVGLLPTSSWPVVIAEGIAADASTAIASITSSTGGDADCPCLPAHTDTTKFVTTSSLVGNNITDYLGPAVEIQQYGIGCHPHDEGTAHCADTNDCVSIVPLPIDCDKSYCKRSWCFIDPDHCTLKNGPSTVLQDKVYSYATCGEVDRFAHTERLQSLKGTTFQVGYAANSGGWKGSYNPEGSFAMNELWTGPSAEFFRNAALEGGFQINLTAPPDSIIPQAEEYFGSSKFDRCVYAVSLGYLDFCVGSFSINEKRSSITTMYQLYSDPIYLIIFAENDNNGDTSWESFWEDLFKILKPFTLASWLMIFFFALPVLGLLMCYHEYDQPGSAYPRDEHVLVESDDGQGHQHTEVVQRAIPKYQHILKSFYRSFLSFFSGSYDQSVVTIGAKLNLLGIASFIMFIIAIYTANLASILTQEAAKPSVDSIEMAVKQGLNICAERNRMQAVIDTFGIDPQHFVPDPLSLGGDGQPGFVGRRERVFESMRRSHQDGTLYCNVAVATLEDLEIGHRYGKHCDKIKIGETISSRGVSQGIGIPINDDKANALVSLFNKMQSKGMMSKALLASTPESQCPETGGEGMSIGVKQLTGVWVIVFSFVVLSLIAKFVSDPPKVCFKKRRRNMSRRVSFFRRSDQWGNGPPTDVVVQGYRYDIEGNELQKVRTNNTDTDTDTDTDTYTN